MARTTIRSYLPRGGPAIVMIGTSLIAISSIIYSHESQVRDRQVMKAGVERDKERLRQKRKMQQQQQEQQNKQ